MDPLKTEIIPPLNFRSHMARYGAEFMRDRSNSLRHIYYSPRLNRWFAVSSERGMVKVNHYPVCPCQFST